MPPKTFICNCKSQGCADAERKSVVTGQIVKGRILSDAEYREHWRVENAEKRSGQRPPQVASNGSRSSLSPHPSLTPCSPLPATSDEVLNHDGCNTLLTRSVSTLPAARSPMEGSPSTDPTDQRHDLTVEQESRVMQLIRNCRLDFHSLQCADISCDGLVFQNAAESPPPPPLRCDIPSNLQFIEYEETMLGLLDVIEKINTGTDEQCRIAKKNIFSSVEDEILRLCGLKLHAWKAQAKSQSPAITCPAPQSGPFREIDTGTRLVGCLTITC